MSAPTENPTAGDAQTQSTEAYTSGAGEASKIQQVPAGGTDDTLGVPQGGTESRFDTSGASVSQREEFQNSEHEKEGRRGVSDMDGPVDTINSVNPHPEPGMEERGPREAQAHAETKNSTGKQTQEDRTQAPHAKDMQ